MLYVCIGAGVDIYFVLLFWLHLASDPLDEVTIFKILH